MYLHIAAVAQAAKHGAPEAGALPGLPDVGFVQRELCRLQQLFTGQGIDCWVQLGGQKLQ